MIKKVLVILSFTFITSGSYALCKKNTVDLDRLSDYSYVLVPGIFNEFITFYMTEYKNFLLANGVPKNQIIRFNSSSFVYPRIEAKRLKERLDEFDTDKPLVFFTHSKGALETLYMLKDFDLSRVHHAYLLQAPFDGISSYDIFYGPLIYDEPNIMKLVKQVMKWSVVSDRYNNFSQESVRPRVKEALSRPGVMEKLSFVISETDYETLPVKLRLMGSIYLSYYDKLGDGVVLKEDQLPDNLDQSKTCVLDIPASHALFVKASPWQDQKIELIHSFIKYILTDQVSDILF